MARETIQYGIHTRVRVCHMNHRTLSADEWAPRQVALLVQPSNHLLGRLSSTPAACGQKRLATRFAYASWPRYTLVAFQPRLDQVRNPRTYDTIYMYVVFLLFPFTFFFSNCFLLFFVFFFISLKPRARFKVPATTIRVVSEKYSYLWSVKIDMSEESVKLESFCKGLYRVARTRVSRRV